jgi:chorismate synthase
VIERRDDAGEWIHRSNNAGGLTGGVSNGQPIVVRAAVKPISTIARPLPTADLVTGEPVEKAHYERSDISVVPAAGVIGEAMVAITLADFLLDKFGGDSLDETLDNVARYRERIGRAPEAPVPGGRRPATAAEDVVRTADEVGSGGDD